MAMNSGLKISYQKLKREIWFDEEDDYGVKDKALFGRLRINSRFRRVHIRRKLKVRIPNLKIFLKRKVRLVKVGLIKVFKRLKESQSHFGELFAGNYVFMQVNPTLLKFNDNNNNNGKCFVKGFSGLSSISRIV